MEEAGMGIGEVASIAGLSVHTLRLYEREDLLINAVARDAGGRRIYGADDVTWLRNCALLRSSGRALQSIRVFAALVRLGPGNEADRLRVLEQHLQHARSRMVELQAAERLITEKIASYSAHLREGTATDLWVTDGSRTG